MLADILRAAAQLPALRRLRVQGGVIGEPDGELQLEEVHIKYVQDASEAAVAACLQGSLRRARFVRVPVSEQLVRERAAHLTALEELDLHTTGTNLAAVTVIDSLRRLYSIQNQIDAPAVAALARMPNLRELSLQDDRPSGSDARVLATSRSLRSLHMDGAGISEEDGHALASARHLRLLHLEGLPPAVLDQLRAAMPECFVHG